jgi:hypothetical protein
LAAVVVAGQKTLAVVLPILPVAGNQQNTVEVVGAVQTTLVLAVPYLVVVAVVEVKVVIKTLMEELGIISPKVGPVTDLRMKMQI